MLAAHRIMITHRSSLANDEPILAEGAGVRVADLVDRVRAGDSIEEVAEDFGVGVESVRLLMEVADAVVHHTKEAARELWEAVTGGWEPVPLAQQLYDSAAAYPGTPIRGKDLYKIGVALGFIEEEEN